jgi:hypothetical protein
MNGVVRCFRWSTRSICTFGVGAFFSQALISGVHGQSWQPSASVAPNPSKLVVMECQDQAPCTPWRLNHGVGYVDPAQGESSVILLRAADSKGDSVGFDRYYFGGKNDGLVARYIGSFVDDNRVMGTYTWLGQTEKHPWYWEKAEIADGVPSVVHFCAENCSTWSLGAGPPHDIPHFGNEDQGGFVNVVSWTPSSVVMKRTERGNCPGTATITGRLSRDGNTLIDGKQTWDTATCWAAGATHSVKLAWGAAIDTVPGCNDMRDHRGPCPIDNQSLPPAKDYSPLVELALRAFFRAWIDSLNSAN